MPAVLPPNPDVVGVARHLRARVLPILTYPNETLHQPCEEVTEFDDGLGQLIMDMFYTMDTNKGIGLAAPQVGVLKNVITLSIPRQREVGTVGDSPTGNSEYESFIDHIVLVNPQITAYGKDAGTMTLEEGCLSVPGYFEKRERPDVVHVTWQTPKGKEDSRVFFGLEAFAVQHEIDHLAGKLFVDELSPLKKQRIRKKVEKTLKRSR